MHQDLAEALTIVKMQEHGLIASGWTYATHTKKRSLGTCNFRSRQILLSVYHIANSELDDILDTILHEIAHALCYVRRNGDYGHGKQWRAVCIEIGARPVRCGKGPVAPAAYVFECPNCGEGNQYYRKPDTSRRRACKSCCVRYNAGRFHPDYVMELVRVVQTIGEDDD